MFHHKLSLFTTIFTSTTVVLSAQTAFAQFRDLPVFKDAHRYDQEAQVIDSELSAKEQSLSEVCEGSGKEQCR